MPTPHLFGPVTPEFAAQTLRGPRAQGWCHTFALHGTADVLLSWHDSWDGVLARLGPERRPEFVAVWLAYSGIPPWFWSAPVPIVGLAADWNLLWSSYRHALRRCDLVLTDAPGVDVLRRAGIDHVRPAMLYGLYRDFLAGEPEPAERDIDVLFVGNLHPAVQGERLPWLARLAEFDSRFKVRIAAGVFGEEYRRLLRRAKIVFNRSVRGECNMRAFEAAASGALLLQEAGNAEVGHWLAEGREFVAYTVDDLEQVIAHYLGHEPERATIAEAARRRVLDYSFERVWAATVEKIGRELPTLGERAAARRRGDRAPTFRERLLVDRCASHGRDVTLGPELTAALRTTPDDLELLYLYGVSEGRAAAFERLLESRPDHHLARLATAELALRDGRTQDAARLAAAALDTLQRGYWPEDLSLLPIPRAEFDWFRVSWERAGWAHASDPAAEGRAKRDLVRWRLNMILGESGDVAALDEADRCMPAGPATARSLGLALAGRPTVAAGYLRRAAAALPFDAEAADTLAGCLRAAGDAAGLAGLIERRRRLALAAPGVVLWEDWFAPPLPPAGALVSVLVLCCNESALTRACLQSVVRHTRAPYELVLVDNGSTDDTPTLLEEIKSWPGPARVAVVRSATNLGYAGGVNLGLAEAKGEWVCLLNNDTRVSPGWLDGLLAAAAAGGPRAGLVGPTSNNAPPPQLVPGDYRDDDGLDEFARRRARDLAGRVAEVPRLTGFCLLARRDVFRQLDGLDEGFSPGFFEDDDFNLRARRAGWRLLLAEAVYVHHEGSRTFRSLGLDAQALLRKNLEKFRTKWGDAEAARFRVPAPAAAPARPPLGRRVSLTMIVRNEEKNLPDCLAGLRELFHQIVVVDTGSTDRTRAVARELGAEVHEFPWADSFAAARNAALGHATGDWVFWLDADDRLDAENRDRLRRLFAELPPHPAAFVVKCECVCEHAGAAPTVVDHVRLFPNDPHARWRHRVHEQILPALRLIGADVRWSDVLVRHVGYVDPALRGRKLDRDLRLLLLELQELPDHPFTHFNLGMVRHERGELAEAAEHLARSLSRSAPGDSITRKLFALLAQCLRQLGRPEEALPVVREGRRHFPLDAELLYLEGQALAERGDGAGAERLARELLAGREGAHFASVDGELRGTKGRHLLAWSLLLQGRLDEAEAEWCMLLRAEPGYGPAWLGLGELCLRRRDWANLEGVLTHLNGRPEAEALRRRATASLGHAG